MDAVARSIPPPAGSIGSAAARRSVPFGIGAGLLGLGLGISGSAWCTQRAACVGTPGLPPADAAAIALTAAVAVAGGSWLAGRLNCAIRLAACVAAACIASGASAVVWSGPPMLASRTGLGLTAGTWVFGCMLLVATAGTRSRNAPGVVAAAAVGMAVGLCAEPRLPAAMSLADVGMLGGIFAILATLLLGLAEPVPAGGSGNGPGGAAAGWLAASAAIVWLPPWMATWRSAEPAYLADPPTASAALLLAVAIGSIVGGGCGRRARFRWLPPAAIVVCAAIQAAMPQAPWAAGAAALAGAALAGVLLGGLALQSRAALVAGAAGAGAAVLLAGEPGPAWLPGSASDDWPVVVAAVLLLRAGPQAWAALAATAALVVLSGASRDATADPHALRWRLADAGRASVHWQRRGHELVLTMDGDRVDAAGPDVRHAELLAVLARVLAPAAADTLVLGVGSGRVARTLAAMDDRPIHVVDHRPQTSALRARMLADGPIVAAPPVRPPDPMGLRVAVGGLRAALRRQVPGGRACIVVAEPLGTGDPGCATVEFQQALRRAAGNGISLQAFDLRHVPVALLRCHLQASATTHPHVCAFVVGDAGVLVGSGQPLDWAAVTATVAAAGDATRWQLHALGFGDGSDLRLACVGSLVAPPAGAACGDDALRVLVRCRSGAREAAVDELRGALRPEDRLAAARLELRRSWSGAGGAAIAELEAGLTAWPHSVLLRAELHRARREHAEAAIGKAIGGLDQQAACAALAGQFVHVGAPSALLQAALGLADRHGERLRQPAAAAAMATALDPTLALAPPPVVSTLPWPEAIRSPIEDLAFRPEGRALALAAGGHGPLAVALRSAWPSACAQALAEAWVGSALPATGDAVGALRELADPFVLEATAARLRAVDRLGDLLAIWRGDLPLPPALGAIAHAPAPERQRLADALAGRGDRDSLAALADLLLDPVPEVRVAAGAALHRTVGTRIDYDPDWTDSRRQAAAARVRALHNRTP